MRKIVLFLSLVATAFLADAQVSTKALFVGNSYTYVNDLPALMRNMVLAGGDTLFTEQSAPGGATFQGHVTNATTTAFLQTPGFDFLILQEQSQRPSFPQSQVQQEVYPYATQLDTMFHQANPCGQTVFYMTWGRKYGDAQNCPFWTPVCTYEGMQMELKQSYLNMASQNNAIVAPVGIAWWEAMLRDTSLELYQGDQSHPALTGSYLAACTFYATMYRRSPVGINYLAGLDPTTASFLQQVAHDVVFDSLTQWRIGLDDLSASFQTSVSGPAAAFTDLSANATSWQWSFGDGNQSQLQNPVHTYSSSGTYTVQLTVSDGCETLSFSDTISVTVVGLDVQKCFTISPNPSNGWVNVQSMDPIDQLQVFDLHGQLKRSITGLPAQHQLKLDDLATGVYVLRVQSAGKVHSTRLHLQQ